MWSLVCAGASTLGVEGQMVEEVGKSSRVPGRHETKTAGAALREGKRPVAA
jgi:hypothetical protein